MELLWDIRVSLDLFLGGLGVGAFLIGAVLFFKDAKIYESLIKKAFILAPILVIAGLVLLLSEIGRPFNVIKTLYAVNPASVMSLGIFLQSAFVAVGLYLAFVVVSKGIEGISTKLLSVGSVLAVMVGLYHGFLLTGVGIESWNSVIPIVFLLSSIVAGASLVFVLGIATLENISTKVSVIINMLLILELAAIFAWAYNLAISSTTSMEAYKMLMSGFGTEFWVLSILVGLLLPLVLLMLVLFKKVSFKAVALPTFITIIIGSFFLKNVVVYLGQAV